MKTELYARVCLLAALLLSAIQAEAQQQQPETQLFGCQTCSTQALALPALSPGATNAVSTWFNDYSFSTSKAPGPLHSLFEGYSTGVRLEYAGSSLVQSETVGIFSGTGIKLRYVEGIPEFVTDPLKDTPQDREMRRRAARKMLLFGGNTFFWSPCDGTGLFLGAKKRSCLMLNTTGMSGIQARFSFNF